MSSCLRPIWADVIIRGGRTNFVGIGREAVAGQVRIAPHHGIARYTNSRLTCRPTSAAARCRLERVMSLSGWRRRFTWVRLVRRSLASRAFETCLFFHGLFELPGHDLLDRLHLQLFEGAFLLEEVVEAAAHVGIAFLAHDRYWRSVSIL